ncbi:hypothetical protein Tco_0750085 [Tanacetum coccineum]|uniref:Reverse transcriptase domain-containing protein n=1 Tax=Tanacetum coccineum TaxID=301880 RepID=A0ABQ4Z087_9ASTR
MPLSVWKKLSLLELTPTRMTLELVNRSVAYPVGVVEDVFVKFADELTLLDPFPLGNKDDNFDPEAELRKIKYLLNQDLSTESSPKTDTSIAMTPILPTMEPKDSLIMGDEDLCTIPGKESDKFIKSSVEDLVPIPKESEDTSDMK